jgi:hypothetical protein
MENNDSPYIYEKPLRSERLGQGAKRTKRLAKLSALGLVGMVGIFGGSAIASNVVTSSRAAADANVNANELVAASDSTTAVTGDPILTEASVDPAASSASTTNAPVISVPFQEAKPKSNSVKVDLPALPNQSFGNTSSATPTAGANASSGSNGGAGGYFAPRGEREDKGERQSFENEYEND